VAQEADNPAFASTAQNKAFPSGPAPQGMVWIPGGEFSMGSNGKCDGESCCSPSTVADAIPIHRVYVDGFWMDAMDVTNAEFEKFVKATGYVTIAERAPTKRQLGRPVFLGSSLLLRVRLWTFSGGPLGLLPRDRFLWRTPLSSLRFRRAFGQIGNYRTYLGL
jgi:formylglycine-generating enzyme required for sulfatase activity